MVIPCLFSPSTTSFSLLSALARSSPVPPPFPSSPLPFLTSSPLPLSFPFLLYLLSRLPPFLLFPTGNPSEVLGPWELVLLLRGSWARMVGVSLGSWRVSTRCSHCGSCCVPPLRVEAAPHAEDPVDHGLRGPAAPSLL